MGSVPISVIYGFKYPINQGRTTSTTCSPVLKMKPKLWPSALAQESKREVSAGINVKKTRGCLSFLTRQNKPTSNCNEAIAKNQTRILKSFKLKNETSNFTTQRKRNSYFSARLFEFKSRRPFYKSRYILKMIFLYNLFSHRFLPSKWSVKSSFFRFRSKFF